MDNKELCWLALNLWLAIAAMICALVSVATASEMLSIATLVVASIALVSTSAMQFYINHEPRPWRSGSAQYQRLKNVTYTQLKSNIEDAERIKQVFYMNAEKCNVTHNTYEKDFGLMLEDLKR